jgi:hypothetical protein
MRLDKPGVRARYALAEVGEPQLSAHAERSAPDEPVALPQPALNNTDAARHFDAGQCRQETFG